MTQKLPAAGGSYTRDPDTGELTRNTGTDEATDKATARAGKAGSKPAADPSSKKKEG